jgi:hypothetical protein
MSQRRQLREFELVKLMLTDRDAFYEEYTRALERSGSPWVRCFTDRDMLRTILAIEFPEAEMSQGDSDSFPVDDWNREA